MKNPEPVIVRACEEDWCRIKALRLAALQDAPDAFASTHEREVAQGEGWWRARLRAPHASCSGALRQP